MNNEDYQKTLEKLDVELVHLQNWVQRNGLKVAILFEGRDAAGKSSAIKRLVEPLSSRTCKVVALSAPSEREQSQWYFQRYIPHLPAAGEIVIFDRSWYNRAGVERVMGFCTDAEYEEFFNDCPKFENMLLRSGVILIKYWFSVTAQEQEKRFQDRLADPTKSWKISPIDLAARDKWDEYSKARDKMFEHTNTKQSPWYVVDGEHKKSARLNMITHLLSLIDYKVLPSEVLELKPREYSNKASDIDISKDNLVPKVY